MPAQQLREIRARFESGSELPRSTASKAGGHGAFRRGVAVTLLGSGLIALVGIATGTLAARLLGPLGRGELAAIQLWPGIVASIGMLGMPEALVYFAARKPAVAGSYTTSAVSLALFGCTPLVIAGYVAMPILLHAQDASTIAAARWYLLIAFGYVFAAIPHAVLRGIGDFAWWNAMRLVPTAVWVAALGGALLLNRADAEFIAGANLLLISLVAVPIMLLTIVHRVPPPYAPVPGDWRPMVRFGLPSALTNVPNMLNLRLDQMLMAAILPAEMLGLYVVAVVWSLSLSPCLGAVATTLFPHVASHAGSERQHRAFVDVVKLSGTAALLGTASLALVTPWILPVIFGSEFVSAVPAALTLVFAAAALGFNQVLEEGLRGLGSPTSVLWSEVGGLVISVALLVLLLRPLGIMGAALASLCGYVSVTALLLRSARHIIGLPLSEIVIPRRRELCAGWKWLLASH